MGKFSKIKKYSKPSLDINEKIENLNKELEKVGMLSEKMTTSNMYTTYEYDSGTPAVDAIPEVPPTYEDVTGGLGGDGDDFSWPDQGDGSDSEAATVIPENLYTTYNGEQVPALRAIDTYDGEQVDYGDHPSLGGLAFKDGWLLWDYLGYLSGSGIRSVGTTAYPGEGVGQAIAEAYARWPYDGKVVKTVYQWESLNCLLGTCKGATEYYPSGSSNTSDPRAERALYAWTVWLPADAEGNLLKNRIMTDSGSPAVPAVPAVPPKPVVLDRFGLGDPDYYIGFIQNALMGALDIGMRGLDYLMGKLNPFSQPGIQIAADFMMDTLRKSPLAPVANQIDYAVEFLSSLKHAGAAFANFLLQQQGVVNYTEESPYEASLPPQDSQAVADALRDVLKTIPRERHENLNPDDLKKINLALNPKTGPTPSNPDRSKEERKNSDEYHLVVNNIGRSDAFKGMIKTDENGEEYVSGINDNYVFTNDRDASVAGAPGLIKFFGTSFGAQDRSGAAGGGTYTYQATENEKAKNVKDVNILKIKLKNMPIRVNLPAPSPSPSSPSDNNTFSGIKESFNLTEGWESPKHTDIESDERKRWFNPSDIAPLYPTKEPNTGIYTPSGEPVDSKEKREPYIKLTQKDLLRNHRLKDSEVKEMMDTINALNAFLEAHPEELIHARKRYPKDDVRLAELNWKMDQMLGASEEYLDGRFPENTRLFNKLQKSIKRNIELTDPKTFKNVKSPVTVNQLFTVDYISKEGIPILKKKTKSKNKKSPARFLKKPRLKTKSEMVQEKLSQLQNDLKKFGMGA